MYKINISGIQDYGNERIRTSVSSEESFMTIEDAIKAYKNGEYNCDTSQLSEIDSHVIQNENGEEVFELT